MKNLYGKEVTVNASKYSIDWEKRVSRPQKIVKDIIRPLWAGDIVCEEFRIPSSKLRIDLVNFTLRIVIEVSPKSSHSFNKFFHKNRSGFLSSCKRDITKQEWCQINGFIYVELTEQDFENPEQIIEKISLTN
jgi:hypothetical protein